MKARGKKTRAGAKRKAIVKRKTRAKKLSPATTPREKTKKGKSGGKGSAIRRQLGLFEAKVPEKSPALGARRKPPVGQAKKPTVSAEPKKPRRTRELSMAEQMAARQREISISEFFTKNRHLLGFDNPQKALLTTVKEAVDNSLDACEEAKILPEIKVSIGEIGPNRFRVCVTDNGPGIVRSQIPKIFGKLLYGSKFHQLKQSRGQQGIGISAAGMYAQLTTGKPVVITSCIRKGGPANQFEIKIDTRRNAPDTVADRQVEWREANPTGTKVEMEIEGIYRAGRRSVDQYLEQTAIANPHAAITYLDVKGEEIKYQRLDQRLPREPVEIRSHPHGVELGVLMTMLKDTRGRDLKGALVRDFSRVSERVALVICEKAGLAPEIKPRRLRPEQVEALHRAMGQVKIMSPPTTCVVPIGEELIRAGLEKGIQADFFTSVTRSPTVYRGYPFQVESGLAWGGTLPADELCTLYRFANRVPLQYQQSDCAINKAVIDTDWRNYRVSQARSALPTGPLLILVHIASVWVPFTSESKEAVARYPEILREIRLALQTCGRRLSQHLSARRREAEEGRKHSYIETYIPHIGLALKEILGLSQREEQQVVDKLHVTLKRSRKFA